MIKKIKNYIEVLNKGELKKRLEYKVKDIFGYFYLRNIIQNRKTNNSLRIPEINYINEEKEIIEDENYRIFNDDVTFEDFLENLKADRIFWRNIKFNHYNDIKIVWEYNRLQILLPLAIKYKQTGNLKYKDQIETILDLWSRSNLFEYSVNWNSNLEVAIRAINIALMLIVLHDDNMNKKYSNLLYLHAKHIYSEISYSDCCIPNNHVVGEATALLVLSQIIECKEQKKWYNKSINIFRKYINIIDDDGVSIENSFSYQFFVTKMFILALCFIKDETLFKLLNDKIIRSLFVLKYTIINEKELFNYGDNDNGFLFSILMHYNIVDDIKKYYNLFLNKITDKETKIYLEVLDKYNNFKNIFVEDKETISYFISKNIFLYKNNNTILFFNAKKIEGHSHNDSLALNLVINNKEILTDAGTYSYNMSGTKRNVYRSREIHNTIQLKNYNKCQPVGTFRWIDKSNTDLQIIKNNENVLQIKGKIDNICERTITIYKNENRIDIEDINMKNNVTEHWVTLEGNIISKNSIELNGKVFSFINDVDIEEKVINISKKYLQEQYAKLFVVNSKNKKISLTIKW